MKSRARWALAIAVTCAAAGCADRIPSEPHVDVPAASARAEAGAGDVVRLLKRTGPLDGNLTTTAVIGPRGGHLQIGRAGVRVDFAPGAVTERTRITMTALGGQNVVYRFEPHGLVFKAPVTVRQSLRNTVAWQNPELASTLQGSYFERLLVDRTESFAGSSERRPARLRDAGRILEFSIEHFSGYMVSTGKVPGDITLEIEIDNR